MPYLIPEEFVNHMEEVHGEAGTAWIERLPVLLDELTRQWQIVIEPPFEPLSYNYVAPVITAEHKHEVLKVGYPDYEFVTEMAAIDHFNGKGIVSILRRDQRRGAMLLEGVHPGNPLSRQQDDRYATQVILEVIERLPQITEFNHSFPTIHRWGQGFDRYLAEYGFGPEPLPSQLVELARTHFQELSRTMGQLRLLHGDLHHGNILYSNTGDWKVIDPKGVIGELSYEFGSFLRNPYPEIGSTPNLANILQHRIDQITSYFPTPAQRIWRWAFSQAVLSAIWSLEDEGHGYESMIRYAEICLEFI